MLTPEQSPMHAIFGAAVIAAFPAVTMLSLLLWLMLYHGNAGVAEWSIYTIFLILSVIALVLHAFVHLSEKT